MTPGQLREARREGVGRILQETYREDLDPKAAIAERVAEAERRRQGDVR